MDRHTDKNVLRSRRRARVRAKISGTPERPRLAVFRSNQYIYAQIIDDTQGKTLISLNDQKLGSTKDAEAALAEGEGMVTPKITRAYQVGMLLAKKAKEQKISQVAFDRAGYRYHGRVKALADGARAGGLDF